MAGSDPAAAARLASSTVIVGVGPKVRGPNTASYATDGQQSCAGAPDHGAATTDESSNGASSDGSGNRPASG
jgi:hypothetical protein